MLQDKPRLDPIRTELPVGVDLLGQRGDSNQERDILKESDRTEETVNSLSNYLANRGGGRDKATPAS